MAPPIDPGLLKAIRQKLQVSRAAAYSRIGQAANRLGETPEIGALEVAAGCGIPIHRYADIAQLQRLRDARAAVPSVTAPGAPPAPQRRATKKGARAKAKPPGKSVWIVHGRDLTLRRAMSDFVRSLGLKPMDWSQVMKATKRGSPYPGDVLDRAFATASAVIVLMTPDDVAKLKRAHWQKGEEAYEKTLTGQARPNVLFEAGIAFGTHPTATVLVEIGKCRPFTDTLGRLVVRMNDTFGKRKDLRDRLIAAGCDVDMGSDAWTDAGNFSSA